MKLITLFVAFWKMKASNIFPKSEYVLKVKLQFPKNCACNVKTSSVKPDLLSKYNQHVQISTNKIYLMQSFEMPAFPIEIHPHVHVLKVLGRSDL